MKNEEQHNVKQTEADVSLKKLTAFKNEGVEFHDALRETDTKGAFREFYGGDENVDRLVKLFKEIDVFSELERLELEYQGTLATKQRKDVKI